MQRGPGVMMFNMSTEYVTEYDVLSDLSHKYQNTQ